jgi:uncharacterized protein
MKVILDTNVVVSGIFFGGKPVEVLQQFAHRRFTLVISHEMLTEYLRVVEDVNQHYPNVRRKMTGL